MDGEKEKKGKNGGEKDMVLQDTQMKGEKKEKEEKGKG